MLIIQSGSGEKGSIARLVNEMVRKLEHRRQREQAERPRARQRAHHVCRVGLHFLFTDCGKSGDQERRLASEVATAPANVGQNPCCY